MMYLITIAIIIMFACNQYFYIICTMNKKSSTLQKLRGSLVQLLGKLWFLFHLCSESDHKKSIVHE